MSHDPDIPAFGLYGEERPFPDVLHCESFSARAPLHDWHIAPHRHAHLAQVLVIETGHMRAKVDNAVWELSGGRFLYVPELSVHEFRFDPGTQGSVFSFPSAVIRPAGTTGQALSSVLSKAFHGALSDHMRQICGVLGEITQRDTRFRAQVAVALVQSLLALLADGQPVEDPRRGRPVGAPVPALDALISEHLADGWSASDYAAALSISTGHLSRLCRQTSGLGAAAYIERKVMTEACRLLAFTRLPISEIGYRLGYSDPSYFSKRFNAAYGQAPSAYRAGFTA
ncbi:MAG: helix-turn-helix domain-containing protein [Pseudomonadota bacterium]